MDTGDGWSFYINDGGKIRNFMIGEQDQTKAQLILQAQFPHINFLDFVSKERIKAELVDMLGLTGGKGVEWAMLEPREPMKSRGVDIDSEAY
jgi:hypothetical protein